MTQNNEKVLPILPSKPPFRPSVPRFVLIIAAITVILAVLIIGDVFPYLRGGFGWRWPYLPAAVQRILPLITATILYIAGAWLLLRRTRRVCLMLLWAMIGAILLPLLVIAVRFDNVAYELFARTASRLTSGPQAAAAVIGWNGPEWRNWAAFVQRPDWQGGHVAVAAPGLPMWYSLIGMVMDHVQPISQPLYRLLLPWQCQNYDMLGETPGQWASAWFGILMPLWASLGVLPLYVIAKHFPRTKRLAPAVALWFPLVPSLVMFAPDWSTFFPFVGLVIFGLLILGIERRRWYWLVLSGVIMGIALFVNYTFAPLLALMGFYTLLHVLLIESRRADSLPWYRPFLIGLWFGAGITLPWLIYWAWSGTSPTALVSLSLTTHLDINRPYFPWVFLHYWDWTLFNGFALMLVWYAGLMTWLRTRRDDPPILALSLLFTVVLLAVSGTGRGESGRVWAIFTPFALLAAAEGLNRRLGDQPYTASWLTLTSVHAALMLALVFSLNVITTDLSNPPATPPAQADLNTINADFSASDGGTFRLTGWSGAISGDRLTLNLRWQGLATNTHPYWFGAVLVAPDGSQHNAGIWQPGGTTSDDAHNTAPSRGTYPTTCWSPGAVIGDTVSLTLPPQKQSGQWWISLAAFGDSGQPVQSGTTQSDGRLQVTLPGGKSDTQVGLGPVTAQ